MHNKLLFSLHGCNILNGKIYKCKWNIYEGYHTILQMEDYTIKIKYRDGVEKLLVVELFEIATLGDNGSKIAILFSEEYNEILENDMSNIVSICGIKSPDAHFYILSNKEDYDRMIDELNN